MEHLWSEANNQEVAQLGKDAARKGGVKRPDAIRQPGRRAE